MKKTLFGILVIASMLNLSSCKQDGFNKDEVSVILSGSNDQIMPLYIVQNTADSSLLRQNAREIRVRHIGSDLLNHLKNRMYATVMDSTNRGVGIAAPQVGLSVRMIYVQRFDKPGEPLEIYYNPQIETLSDSTSSGTEGCLSVPGFRNDVERANWITLSYLDSLGNYQEEKINDFTAVIFQHEIDHINGKLYYDHVDGGFNALQIDRIN